MVGERFEYWTIDYQCQIAGPDVTIRLQATRMIGSDIVFITSSSEVDKEDQPLAERLLSEVQVNP
jgi:hypothetical protein